MAKNDKKINTIPAEDKQPEVISAVKPAPEPHKPEPHKPPHPAEPPHKKRHGLRNFVLFIILLAVGAVGYLTMQLRQTEKLNTEALNKLQQAYDEKLNKVTDRVNILDREVVGLKNRPIVEHAAGISENQLNQKLAALRDELMHRLGATDIAKETVEGKPAQETAENTGVADIPPFTSVTQSEKTTQEILLASGAIIVRDLAEQGVDFAYEAEVLQILAQGNDLAAKNVQIVRSYANSGITGKNKLIRAFDKIFAELNTAETKSETAKAQNTEVEAKWYLKVWNWIKSQVIAKKRAQKPVFTPQKDEVLDLVNEGRLQDALNALRISEKYSKVDSEPLRQWRMQAERYLEFDSAINAVIMNALANIRLKEMEH